MEKAALAEQRIKTVCDRLGISEGGRLWMDIALDPFKDIVQKPIGYPDRNMAPTVIQTVHDSINISKPSDLGEGNWDCMIFLDQVWQSQPLFGTTAVNIPTAFQKTAQSTTGYNRGGLVVRADISGQPLNTPRTKNDLCRSLVTDVFEAETSARIIGIGFEIHNTTAEIHKQGSIVTFRICDELESNVYVPIVDRLTSKIPLSCEGVELAEPPYSVGQAIDQPGSVQWDAKDGAYIVPTFSSESNQPKDLKPFIVCAKDGNTGTRFVPPIKTDGTDTVVYFDENYKNVPLPTTLVGAYMTGLSPESTFTVNLQYYIEQFPAFDSPMHRISAPSCQEDFKAIELYTQITRQMPTGVKVDDNFSAAFISGVSRVAQMVTKYAPTVVRGIGALASAADMFGDSRSTEKLTNLRDNNQVMERQIITTQPRNSGNKGQLITKQITTTVKNNTNNKNSSYSGRSNIKNKRDKDYNRLDRYIQAGAGNRIIK